MRSKNRMELTERVTQAADAAVREKGYATAIDVMLGIGWLQPSHVLEWRTRRLPFLESGIQANLSKVSEAMRLFAAWAANAGLQPSIAEYSARTANRERLRFSKSGEAAIEAAWQTHWVSPNLTDAKCARVAARAQKPPDLVVVAARHSDWRCHRCSGTGQLLVMEPPGPACLNCAGLGHLEELPAGDALVTRRARSASKLSAVIVRWSRTRKRYERIGVLVEPAALAKARGRTESNA
ncbi:MAG: hypothetical protein KDC87_04380 [Planctomycetes bacterium]|nr:hypothetical protein [Planctomycetota bacterium]MCB9870179.1 hypothetical protein [Planctomycetota bacterium]